MCGECPRGRTVTGEIDIPVKRSKRNPTVPPGIFIEKKVGELGKSSPLPKAQIVFIGMPVVRNRRVA